MNFIGDEIAPKTTRIMKNQFRCNVQLFDRHFMKWDFLSK